MTLIDADEFRKTLKEFAVANFNIGEKYLITIATLEAVDDMLVSAPTVEAISIEWLKKWEEKHKNDPCYCNFVTDEILADWEKENG